MTPDPERVKEAKTLFWEGTLDEESHDPRITIMRVLDAWLSGTDIQWCEVHESPGDDDFDYCEHANEVGEIFDPHCRIVTRRLSGP